MGKSNKNKTLPFVLYSKVPLEISLDIIDEVAEYAFLSGVYEECNKHYAYLMCLLKHFTSYNFKAGFKLMEMYEEMYEYIPDIEKGINKTQLDFINKCIESNIQNEKDKSKASEELCSFIKEKLTNVNPNEMMSKLLEQMKELDLNKVDKIVDIAKLNKVAD